MTQAAWLHIGILLLAFVSVVAFILRRMVLPAARKGAHGESIGIGGGDYSGGHGGHSHDSGGGDGGSGD